MGILLRRRAQGSVRRVHVCRALGYNLGSAGRRGLVAGAQSESGHCKLPVGSVTGSGTLSVPVGRAMRSDRQSRPGYKLDKRQHILGVLWRRNHRASQHVLRQPRRRSKTQTQQLIGLRLINPSSCSNPPQIKLTTMLTAKGSDLNPHYHAAGRAGRL